MKIGRMEILCFHDGVSANSLKFWAVTFNFILNILNNQQWPRKTFLIPNVLLKTQPSPIPFSPQIKEDNFYAHQSSIWSKPRTAVCYISSLKLG